jgi:Na+/phosphate symporter
MVTMTDGMKAMTLIEAMKELGHIEKRIEKTQKRINEYCATLQIERFQFDTEEKQTKEVASLIQSCLDLEANSRLLKMRIEYTNLKTKVEIKGKMYTISELLFMTRKTIPMMLGVFSSLNENNARARLRNFTIEPGKPIQIIKHYKEDYKNTQLDLWQDMKETITGRLEVVNATTQLLEFPE